MNTYPVCALIPPLGQASSTWANFPAASSVPVGTCRTATDYNYTEWYSDGTYWKPRGGRQRIINALPAFSSTGTTSEVAAYTPTIPANMLFPGVTVETGASLIKTGTANSLTLRARYNGAAGAILAWGGTMSATNLGSVAYARFYAGAASGGSITLTQSFAGSTPLGIGNTNSAAVTAAHTMANAVTLNYTLQLANAADTGKLDHVYVEICG